MAECRDGNPSKKQLYSRGRFAVAARLAVFAALAAILGGCASGASSSAFVDPSKYDLYDCRQLATARAASNSRVIELEGLMAKAETGVAGGLVSGLAYQTDYLSARAQRDLIDEKFAASNCSAELAAPAAPASPVGKKQRR